MNIRENLYDIGENVWVNGYDKCNIKSGHIRRQIIDIQIMALDIYYQCKIGISSTGKTMLHWYPEARLSKQNNTLVSVLAPAPKIECVALMLRPENKIIVYSRVIAVNK